jgi:hypothetical protein
MDYKHRVGSSSTKVPVYTTELIASNDIVGTVINSATLGFKVTANMACTGVMIYTQSYNTTGVLGIVKNKAEPITTAADFNAASTIMGMPTYGVDLPTQVVALLDLEAGDYVNPNVDGNTFSTAYNSITVILTEK